MSLVSHRNRQLRSNRKDTESSSDQPAFQDLIPGNHCWGCGPDNRHGLHVKSHWDGEESVCTWQPQPFHMAGPTHILNGGIIASIFDCHCICTAIAAAYRRENRPLDSPPPIWYATASLDVTYLRPTPIEPPVTLRARVVEMGDRKTTIEASLYSAGKERCQARVVAVRVPEEWRSRDPGPEM